MKKKLSYLAILLLLAGIALGASDKVFSTWKLKFLEAVSDGGAFNISVIPPNLSASYSLTLPVDDGSTDQVLKTNGSGILSWVNTFADVSTTKGDIFARTSSAVDRVAVGSNGSVLTADTNATTGVAWKTINNPNFIRNIIVQPSVAANALTVSLKTELGSNHATTDVGYVAFDNTGGGYDVVTVLAATSVVISSGSTLGHFSGSNEYIYVYLINNASTAELAVSSTRFDENTVQSTTAEGGAGAADSKTVMYSTTARSNVAVRLIGRWRSSQATAGTWASAIPEASMMLDRNPQVNSSIRLYTPQGHGSTNTVIRYYNTSPGPTTVGTCITYARSATNGDTFTINCDGRYWMMAIDFGTLTGNLGFSVNSSQVVSTSIASITAADRLAFISTVSNWNNQVTALARLKVGDIVRVHTDGGMTSTNANNGMEIHYLGD